jgi:hypothetical protein
MSELAIVDDTVISNRCTERSATHSPHNPRQIHRGPATHCGNVGKLGTPQRSSRHLFQFPRIAQPGFRNLATQPNPHRTTRSSLFPLFRCERRRLRVFITYSFPFSPLIVTPRQGDHRCRSASASPRANLRQIFSSRGVKQSRSMSRNPEMKPCFPRTVFRDPEYNQDQETQPYPAARLVL